MFISHTPISLPVSTANVAVESIAKEASLKPRIPEAPPTNPSSNSKHSTDFSEQNKLNLLDSLIQDKTIKEQTEGNGEQSANGRKDDSNSDDASKEASNGGSSGYQSGVLDLDQVEQQEVAKLQAIDREIRAHEAAHASVGGSLTGSPNLNFTSGPDGKRYATSGDVSIDISKVANDPSATIAKLKQVLRAALAPAQPSSQDRKVASIASAGIGNARMELSLDIENSKKFQQASDSQSEVNSSNEPLNPVKAIRESRDLARKLEDSGAFESQSTLNQFSLIA